MKSLIFFALISASVPALALSEDSDFLCKGTDTKGQAFTVKFDSWADNRNSARADVTFDFAGIGPRTTVDLYVSAGDSESGGGDFNVGEGDWYLEFFKYSDEVVEAHYFVGEAKPLILTCKETRF